MEVEEIWKDIPVYEGLYQASTLGRIKALEKVRATGRKGTTIRVYPERIMKFQITPNGYYMVCFSTNEGRQKYLTVHRLIGVTFIPNPENKAIINHKRGIKTDNRYTELEWSTHSENSKHAFDTGLMPSIPPTPGQRRKKVIDIVTNKHYPSIKAAANANGLTQKVLQSRLNGKYFNNTNLRLFKNENILSI